MLDFGLLANNALFESLVKNKIHRTRSKSHCGRTDSDVSSDVATSSDRMGDFDDEIGGDNQSNESKAVEDDDGLAIEYEDDNSTQLSKDQPQRISCSVLSSLPLISPVPSSPARSKFHRLNSTPDKLRSIPTWHGAGISKGETLNSVTMLSVKSMKSRVELKNCKNQEIKMYQE
uniref:Uncharacterized protein n=1 Tax=Romanomermis culicivorax TaxID=13658 RepID=A0A915I524_ROMCU